MGSNSWLSRGFQLPDGSKHTKLIAYADNWQIILTSTERFALIVHPSLFAKWEAVGLVSTHLFGKIDVAGVAFHLFISKNGYLVSSAQYGPYPNTNIEARAFAIALRETRKVVGNIPLHDAVYIEQLSILLPTYTMTERIDDQTLLGTWLAAGVRISISSYRRLCGLLAWMDEREVRSILNESGLPTGEGGFLSKVDRSEHKETGLHETSSPMGSSSSYSHFYLPGRPDLEAFFNEHVVDIIANEEKYRRMGIGFPAAIVLQGPPGCGKTFAVERLVEFLDWPSYTIDSGSIGSPYIHDTSKKIAEIFDRAISNAPSVIVIDEMEAFLTDRNIGQSSGLHHVEEVSEFLRRIPEAVKNHVLVVAMTNMIDSIDPAVIRRGRFDHVIEVKMPSAEEVSMLLSSLLSKLPTLDDIDIDKLADKLKCHPMSDVAFVVKEAGRITVRSEQDRIDNSTLLAALDLLPENRGEKRKIGF